MSRRRDICRPLHRRLRVRANKSRGNKAVLKSALIQVAFVVVAATFAGGTATADRARAETILQSFPDVDEVGSISEMRIFNFVLRSRRGLLKFASTKSDRFRDEQLE